MTLLQIGIPAISAKKPAMEELIGFFAGDLGAHEADSWDQRLLAFAAVDDSVRFHLSSPEPCLPFPVGQFIS